MKNAFIISILFFFYGIAVTFAQGTQPIDSVAASLSREMQNDHMEQAYLYAHEIISRNEPVSNQTLLNCADCLILNKDYSGCIAFCDNWKTSHAADSTFYSELFDAAYGECHYFLGNHELACKYLAAYFNQANEKGFRIGTYHMGIFASSLHENYQFARADSIYSQYLNTVLESENLTVDNIHRSTQKAYIGYKLYEWAYNKMFQGDEKADLDLLKMAAACDNEAALADYQILSQSPTFAKEVKHKKKIIREFNNYLAELDSRQLTHEAQSGFWHDVQHTNNKYKELQETLVKPQIPGTLQKALTEMETNRHFVESGLTKFNPYRADIFEKGLDKRLCGEESFLKELRIYPADIPNAFATPFGQIYLTEGLARLYHFNNHLLIGICAHEATHYLCQHALIGLWQQKKKEKKNKIWAAVAVGLHTALQASAALYEASSGVQRSQSYWDDWAKNVSSLNNSFIQAFQEDAYYFQFKYARRQEIEADLMAYRFCESIGLGGYAYIIALELLGDKQGYLKPDPTSDHPTNAYRIGLLKHLYISEHNASGN